MLGSQTGPHAPSMAVGGEGVLRSPNTILKSGLSSCFWGGEGGTSGSWESRVQNRKGWALIPPLPVTS